MGKEIGLGLVYRDMWQSAGKYMPRVDQLVRVAEPIIEMGCFRRVETNGGGFEQINLLYGENPNTAVRAWTKPFREAGIQTHMLERGLNGLRMYPVPADVRKLMFALKKKQGTDIARSFDGLNDVRNLRLSIEYAKAGGMVAQACLCIAHSPLHTVDYYVNMARELLDMGAEEICIKDMAGIGRPVAMGKLVKGIKTLNPSVLVTYHGHSGPGFSVASSLEAARNGADFIDVGMEPLSFGTGHADLLTVHEVLRDAGFSLPDINMKAYMQARSLTQEFIDDFLGYYISSKNRMMNALLIGPGLPGGMMGSLMADLENNLSSLNQWKVRNGQPELTQDDLLILLFEEVEKIWPMLGYPPLVTPYSQYVKNAALMNVIQLQKGKERWSLLDDNTWDMLLGKSGRVPGEIAEELQALAKAQQRSFFEGDPQSLYPNVLDDLRAEMKKRGWDTGPDEEELFEFAMHPQQYEAYKSGKAKKDFEADLAKKQTPETIAPPPPANSPTAVPAPLPREMDITVDGSTYRVSIAYPDQPAVVPPAATPTKSNTAVPLNGSTKHITAPLEGKIFLTKDAGERPLKVGDQVKKGDIVLYIEAMKVTNAIKSEETGTVAEILVKEGDTVYDDDVLIKLTL